MKKRTRIAMATVAAAAVVAATVAGCGGGGDAADETATSPVATETPGSATAAIPATSPTQAPSTPTAAAVEPTSPPVPPTAPVVQSTQAPAPTQAPPPPPPQVQGTSLTIAAIMTKFSPTGGTIAVGAPVTVTFNNQDDGVSHDIVFYAPGGAQIAATGILAGPASATVTFTPAIPGTYAFKCSVHPRDMNGALTAQ